MKNLGITFLLAVAFLFTATLAQAQTPACNPADCLPTNCKVVSCNKTKTASKADKTTKASLVSLGVQPVKKSEKNCVATCKKAGKASNAAKTTKAPKVMTVGNKNQPAKKKTCNPAACTKKTKKVTLNDSKEKTTKTTLAVKN